MLVLTIIFLTYNLIRLFKGKPCFETGRKLCLQQIELFTSNEDKKKELQNEMIIPSLKILITFMTLIIFKFIYLVSALKTDIFRYPTLILLGLSILSVVYNAIKKDKKDLTTEHGREKYKEKIYSLKKYSFLYFCQCLVYIVYYSYMFYIITLR